MALTWLSVVLKQYREKKRHVIIIASQPTTLRYLSWYRVGGRRRGIKGIPNKSTNTKCSLRLRQFSLDWIFSISIVSLQCMWTTTPSVICICHCNPAAEMDVWIGWMCLMFISLGFRIENNILVFPSNGFFVRSFCWLAKKQSKFERHVVLSHSSHSVHFVCTRDRFE